MLPLPLDGLFCRKCPQQSGKEAVGQQEIRFRHAFIDPVQPMRVVGCREAEYIRRERLEMAAVGLGDEQKRRGQHPGHQVAELGRDEAVAQGFGGRRVRGLGNAAHHGRADPMVGQPGGTCARASAALVPGRRRRFTVAVAVVGTTLSLMPAWNIVGTRVVRTAAAPTAVLE